MINKKLAIDGRELLSRLKKEVVSAIFFDPQYRSVLNKLKYGNEGKKQKGRFKLPQMSDEMIKQFLIGFDHVLKPSGYLFFWMDKYMVCEATYRSWLPDGFHVVDKIVWHDPNMFSNGYRSRTSCNHLIVIQKKPLKAKSTWTDHSIRDCWVEELKDNFKQMWTHPKAPGLIERLIGAVTKPGDLVCDPCAGSFIVFDICKKLDRYFAGTDIYTGEVK